MTTIYKTTMMSGRRAIGSLPCSKADALDKIVATAKQMGWRYHRNGHAVTIVREQKDMSETYTAEENNSYLCP